MRVPVITVLLLAPIAPAQTLLALEARPNGGPVVQEFLMNCTPLRSCTLPAGALPTPPAPPFGGIAWSGQAVVVTDGVQITTLDLQCNQQMTCQVRGFNTLYDIALDGPANVLHVTDGNSLGAIPLGCPTGGNLLRRATPPAPLQMPITAIDVDRSTGDLWVCDAAGAVARVTFTSQWSAAVVTSFPARSSIGFPPPVLPILGLAFDPCAGRVYLADSNGAVIDMDLQGNPRGWCSGPVSAPGAIFLGLTRRPVQPWRITGACAPAGMPSCTPNVFTSGGDAVLGNRSFRLEVDNAPYPASGPTQALLVVDFAQGATNVPGLCAPLQLAGTPLLQVLSRGPVLSSIATGTPPCHGAAWAPMPVPNATGLCGLRIFAQWAFVDASGRVALSDAIVVTVD